MKPREMPGVTALLLIAMLPAGALAQQTAEATPDINVTITATDSPADPGGQQQQAQQQPALSANMRSKTPIECIPDVASYGSAYVPLDSWIYPAVMRLFSLGYVDSAYLGMRPWTRVSVAHMLQETCDKLSESKGDEQAREIYATLRKELTAEIKGPPGQQLGSARFESAYTRALGIGGTPLRDSYHLGSTIVNDFGRPYEEGFNNVTGFSARGDAGRYSAYFRGEYQFAPSATGYSSSLAQQLAALDQVPFVPQDTIPAGPIAATNSFRVLEGYAGATFFDNEFSFGKQEAWMGPGLGGGMAWSNNADNNYSFRVNRVEPLVIPWLSKLTGPWRYDFFVGTLQGHTYPNAPWVHAEKLSFKPTRNVEIGFERTVIWGGAGHVPITLRTFFRSFFSLANVTAAEKNSRDDPGARFGAFDFSWRLPFVRKYLTLYTDSEAHDDISPISAPRRAAIRPGLYLSQFPRIPKLDLRVEAASTDPPHSRSHAGQFMYYEIIQRQAYTNKGQIFGDWIGRESKGGQAWLTYHLSGNEMIQISYRNAKAAKDFIAGGTTQNLVTGTVIKRIGKDVEVNGQLQFEGWKAPIYKAGKQYDTSASVQVTWYPKGGVRRF